MIVVVFATPQCGAKKNGLQKRSLSASFDSRLCCLCSVHAHPCLLHQAQQLVHIATPIVHHVLCAPLFPKVDDLCGPVDPRPNRTRDNQPCKGLFGLLRGQVEQRSQPRERDPSVVLRDNSNVLKSSHIRSLYTYKTVTYMLDNSRMEVLPTFI